MTTTSRRAARRSRRAGRRSPLAVILCVALSAGLILLFAPVARAQVTGQCVVSIQGRDAGEIADWPDAVDVDANGTVTIQGRSTQPVSFLKVELDFAGLRWAIRPQDARAAGGNWSAVLSVADHAGQGVGLYHVVASTDGCTAEGWINVVGRSPFTTLAGVVATGIAPREIENAIA